MSITVPQLFHRIARRARASKGGVGGDYTRLSMTEQTDLAEAANTALQSLYGLLPAVFKEKTQGFLLPAPLAITLAVTTQSNVVPDGSFTADQIGRSIVLDGDGNWNQVIDTNRLLNPYMGPISATVAGTVYGDAFHSDEYPFDRIISNPRFPVQGQTNLLNPVLLPLNSPGLGWFYQAAIGQPQYWWTQALSYSQGNEPIIVMRVTPAPSIATALSVRISYWPKRLTLADYDAATRIPVPDQFIEKSLIPLGLRALMSTPIWDDRGDDAKIEQRAEEGEQFLKMQPGQIASPANRVFTPLGY